MSMQTYTYFKYLVHKLLGIVTRFFVSFIKVPVLPKISICPFVPNIANQLTLLQTIP